ncbi:SDR family oxidoreductase [Cohnella panacarvi]|uniref:SDR family oxidoreductase n=1 Tax=Cohnella panacarvi TaxID=400776 RepID=UPI00047C3796|nr:SDR family oxidoreductase [Cohnella panacarvi]
MLADKRNAALVTGAGSGFGLLTALLLAEKGWMVYAGLRDSSRSEGLVKEATARGIADQVVPLQLDVTDCGQIAQAVETIRQRQGRLDALVNNAGFAAGGFVEEVPLERWREQFETNVFGLVAMTQAVLPMMRAQRSGRIVLISSVSGRIGFPALAPYVASKHAVEGFGESLRLEVAGFGIGVSLIEAGPYRTEIWRKSIDSLQEPTAESAYRGYYVRLKPIFEHNAETGGDPSHVAASIWRAISDNKPKLRYQPTSSEKKTLRAKQWLPWGFIERMALKAMGVKKS